MPSLPTPPAGDVPARSLPAPITPLIGREREITAGVAALASGDVRLLTLTGSGGIGKTRVALAVAERLGDAFADGVAFVDLAAIADPALVTSTVAHVLQVAEAGDEPLVEGLRRRLQGQHTLLVLDNFEQVAPAAPLIAELLTGCPKLAVLVTSRTALHLSGEHEIAVPPLALPETGRQLGPDALAEHLTRYPAVALFVQRARAAWPDFELTAENAPTVAEICRRLDGLPLAIELAAARVKLLPPRALLARLGRRLGLLTGGPRDRPARQQTLRDTLDWSYRLLDDDAQALFARLTVFVGGCTLEAAEAVCGTGHDAAGERPLDVLTGLATLVDQSLVRRQAGSEAGSEARSEAGSEDEARFGMLEIVREYAAERLDASGAADVLRQRHARLFLTLAEQAEPELTGPRQGHWLERLEREHDNLRAALGWALDGGEAETGVRLAVALARFWDIRGYLSEGQRWLERALARCPDGAAELRATVLTATGGLAYSRCDYARASALHEEALALCRALGDRAGVATSLHNLSRVRFYQGQLAQVETLCRGSLAIRRELGDRRGIAMSLNTLGVVARNRGDYVAARAAYEESLTLFRALGDRWGISLLLNNLARIARDLGDWERTAALCAESLALFRELGDRHGIAWVLSNLAIVARRRGAPERAARLFGAAEALSEAVGSARVSMSPGERTAYDAEVAAARTVLGETVFEAARAAGRVMPLEQTVGLALSETGATAEMEAAPAHPETGTIADAPDGAGEAPATGSATGPATGPTTGRTAMVPAGSGPATPEVARQQAAARQQARLTRREREVAALVARGLTDREIAAELVITEGTVGVHLDHIFGKLGIHARAQLAAWAVEHGISTARPA